MKRRRLLSVFAVVAAMLPVSAYAEKEPWYWGLRLNGGGYLGPVPYVSLIAGANYIPPPRTTVGADLNIYWPLWTSTLVGARYQWFGGLSNSSSLGTVLHSMQGSLTGSIMHAFSEEPGSGWLAHFEVGIGNRFYVENGSLAQARAPGIDWSVGGGYGFAISSSTKLLVDLSVGQIIDDHSSWHYAVSVGPLF